MYLEPGKCAQCGKIIAESAKFAPHNVEYNSYAVHKYRPYFCSPHCLQSAVDSFYSEDAELKNLNTKWDSAKNVYERRIKDSEDEYKNKCKKLDADHDAFIKRIARLTDNYSGNFYGDDGRQILDHESSTIDKKNQAYRSHLDWTDGIRTNYFEELGKIGKPRATLLEKAIQDAKLKLFSVYHTSRNDYEIANAPPSPPTITDAHRFEHTHILGPTGSGKTTLIQQLVMADLAKPNPPAIVIIDPKGRMVERIAKLKYLIAGPEPPLIRRVVIINPTHTPAPPMNLFKQTGSAASINYAINNFDYLFAQAGSELSPMMRPLFRFCARLMFSIPNADILMLMDFLESKPGDPRFQPYIDQLTDIGAKRFFTKDFYAEGYRATREQVKRRFNDILSMPEILAAFTSPSPPLDLERCLQERAIVLVHTGLTTLGPMESRILGRHIINLTIGAAFARGTNGPPAFLYIDEFQDFVDDQATAKQLRLAREYNLGIICAHQNMYCEELNDALRSAISGNTAIKYCAKVYGSDRSYMLKDLGCNEEFLDAQVQDKAQQFVRFACVVKGHPPFPISIKYPNITPEHHMAQSYFDILLTLMQQKLHPAAPKHAVKPALDRSSDTRLSEKADARKSQDAIKPPIVSPQSIQATNRPAGPAHPPLSNDPGEPSDKW
jgi:hypothetical protein